MAGSLPVIIMQYKNVPHLCRTKCLLRYNVVVIKDVTGLITILADICYECPIILKNLLYQVVIFILPVMP